MCRARRNASIGLSYSRLEVMPAGGARRRWNGETGKGCPRNGGPCADLQVKLTRLPQSLVMPTCFRMAWTPREALVLSRCCYGAATVYIRCLSGGGPRRIRCRYGILEVPFQWPILGHSHPFRLHCQLSIASLRAACPVRPFVVARARMPGLRKRDAGSDRGSKQPCHSLENWRDCGSCFRYRHTGVE